ncbi:MAG: TetR/AcrR family transcriptional regulator [Actinobacteria bacterium]|nr:TetR/AcrR family transcriptional regulator [Actinomycetota bacterium]
MKPEERRAELIEAARRVFRRKGYAAASVTDIVKEAGVSQGTYYFYFKDKEAAFDAVAETIVLEGFNAIQGITKRGDLSALDKIERTAGFLLALETAERWTDERAARRLEQMRERVGRIAFRLYLPVVTDLIQQGITEGTMDVPYPEATAAYFLQASLFHLDVLKGSGTMSSEEWWDAYLDFVTRVFGLKSKPGFRPID